jgi:hypothetical protein
MRLGEASDDLRHVAVGVVVRRANPQRSFQSVVVEGGDRLIIQPDDAARVVEQLLALSRQAIAAPVLGEELLADPFLQPPHLHGNRRLRLEHAIGCLREAAGVDDGEEGVELVDIEWSGHERSSIRVADSNH